MGWPQSQWPEFRNMIDPNDFMVPQVFDPNDLRWSKGRGVGTPPQCVGSA